MNNHNVKTVKKNIKPGSLLKVDKMPPPIKSCDHNLQPLEYIYGKYIPRGADRPGLWVWDALSSNAHKCRVVSYWCYKCNKIIHPPKPIIAEED